METNKPRCWEVNQRTSAVVGMRSNESLNQEASFVMRVTVEWSLRGKIELSIIWIWDMNKRKDLTPKFLAWLSNRKVMVLGNKGTVIWFKLQIWWALSFRQCEFLGLALKREIWGHQYIRHCERMKVDQIVEHVRWKKTWKGRLWGCPELSEAGRRIQLIRETENETAETGAS